MLQTLPEASLAQPIVIAMTQNVPNLLDEVHRLIETNRYSFVLCGSSARKLKRLGVNLLGGRAWRSHMYALTTCVIGEFDLLTGLNSNKLKNLAAECQLVTVMMPKFSVEMLDTKLSYSVMLRGLHYGLR